MDEFDTAGLERCHIRVFWVAFEVKFRSQSPCLTHLESSWQQLGSTIPNCSMASTVQKQYVRRVMAREVARLQGSSNTEKWILSQEKTADLACVWMSSFGPIGAGRSGPYNKSFFPNV